ncbi:DUF2521 family protein [Lederbergia lenta]|uniref:KINB signaling pathway activation protein n=1 Tax=Lederbergia lenta TaxID=1467 RepID=A0A2X4VKS0_LEDLE|nr:DUF2521 family protein [Lederbergia lenta]MCM3113254.1 YbaK family protein [Lederbergia lenta]MEC2326403.1 DUF2521 family protein [Lederbergia lenta]SQI51411.1 KINB signaling pathway activation protein [Lederbergia lenta]
MSVITNFEDRKRKKQLTNERKILSDLSINALKKSVLLHFYAARLAADLLDEGIEEACLDVAIEAYLLGADFGRFIVVGETMEMTRKRCHQEIAHFTETLYHFWLYLDYDRSTLEDDSIYIVCEKFVQYWWKEGYLKAERRYKLRLH